MKWKRYSCIALFILICTFTIMFLNVFTKDTGEAVLILEWEEMFQAESDGTMLPFELSEGRPAEGRKYVFSTVLKEIPKMVD